MNLSDAEQIVFELAGYDAFFVRCPFCIVDEGSSQRHAGEWCLMIRARNEVARLKLLAVGVDTKGIIQNVINYKPIENHGAVIRVTNTGITTMEPYCTFCRCHHGIGLGPHE